MRGLKALLISTIGLSALSSTAVWAQDDDDDDSIALFDELIVFGDSISDPGNLPGILGGFDFPPAPYFENQFSNGPIYTFLIDDLLGFEADRDLNFAVGGARSGPGVTQAAFGSDHINAFLNGNGSGAQIERFLATGRTVSPFDLFVLNIGGNDFLGFDPAVDDAAAVVNNAVGNVTDQVNTLIGAGAQHIVVAFVPDTGLTPSIRSGGPALIEAGTALTTAHNLALAESLSALTQTTDTLIYAVDSATLLQDVADNPDKFGFTNVTEACFSGGVVCANPDEFLFFDGVHPTSVGHEIIAAATADTIISTRLPGAAAEVTARTAQDWDHTLSLNSRSLDFQEKWAWIGQAQYFSGERDSQRLSLGYEYDGFAATLGVARLLGDYRIGVVASYGRSETDYNLVDGGLETDSIRFGGFVSRDVSKLTATVTGSVSFDAHDLERETNVADQEAEATTEGRTFLISGELRGNFIEFENAAITLDPFVRVTWQDTNIDAYAESGAVGLDRIVDEVEINPSNAEFGVDGGWEHRKYFAGMQASWIEGIESDSQTFTTSLVTIPDVPVTITTEGTDDSYGRLSGILGYTFSENLNIALIGSTQFARDEAEGVNGFVRVNGRF